METRISSGSVVQFGFEWLYLFMGKMEEKGIVYIFLNTSEEFSVLAIWYYCNTSTVSDLYRTEVQQLGRR